jgi:hypothetical protein
MESEKEGRKREINRERKNGKMKYRKCLYCSAVINQNCCIR